MLTGCETINITGVFYGTEFDGGIYEIMPGEECNGRPIWQKVRSKRFLYYTSGGKLSNWEPGWTVKWYSDFTALECTKVGQIFAYSDEYCPNNVTVGTWFEKNGDGELVPSDTVRVECGEFKTYNHCLCKILEWTWQKTNSSQ